MKILGIQKIKNKTAKKRLASSRALQFVLLILLGIIGILGPIVFVPIPIVGLIIALAIATRLATTLVIIWKTDKNTSWVKTSAVIIVISFLLGFIMDTFYDGLFAVALFGVFLTFLHSFIFSISLLTRKYYGKGSKNDDLKDISLKEGKEFIKSLDGLYASVPSGKKSPIAKQIKRIREASMQAFKAIDKNPALASKTHELMDYCLPQTLKLMENYLDFANKKVKGDNIEKILEKIVQSLDAMCDAVDKQLNNLYADMVLDVKTDMAVTKSIANKEN